MRKMTFVIILILILLSQSCAIHFLGQPSSIDVENPDMFLLGQSNATSELAIEISIATGLEISQIKHGGNPIENWIYDPYNWAQVDKDFIRDRAVDYIIWFQGESNWDNYTNYEERFIQALDIMYPDHESIVVIIIQVYRINVDQDTTGIREVQRSMVEARENWYLIDSSEYSRYDLVHLDTNGQKDLAQAIQELIFAIDNDN
jgi:hypothetical protein